MPCNCLHTRDLLCPVGKADRSSVIEYAPISLPHGTVNSCFRAASIVPQGPAELSFFFSSIIYRPCLSPQTSEYELRFAFILELNHPYYAVSVHADTCNPQQATAIKGLTKTPIGKCCNVTFSALLSVKVCPNALQCHSSRFKVSKQV